MLYTETLLIAMVSSGDLISYVHVFIIMKIVS